MVTAFNMWNANLGIPGTGGRGTVHNDTIFYSLADNAPPYVNIVDITHANPGERTNRLLVRYGGGLFAIDQTDWQEAAGEIIEDYLTVDIADRIHAEDRAWKQLLDVMAGQPAITMTVQPAGPPPGGEGGPPPAAHDVPYINFFPGDWVLAPMVTAGHASYRVVAITITGDDEGNASIVVELNRRVFSAEQQRQSLFQTLGSGVIGTSPPSEKVDGYVNSGD